MFFFLKHTCHKCKPGLIPKKASGSQCHVPSVLRNMNRVQPVSDIEYESIGSICTVRFVLYAQPVYTFIGRMIDSRTFLNIRTHCCVVLPLPVQTATVAMWFANRRGPKAFVGAMLLSLETVLFPIINSGLALALPKASSTRCQPATSDCSLSLVLREAYVVHTRHRGGPSRQSLKYRSTYHLTINPWGPRDRSCLRPCYYSWRHAHLHA